MDFSRARLRAAGLAVLASVFVLTTQAPAPVAAAEPAGTNLAAIVVADAESHLGAPYQWGATGPSSFDCSGLVYRVFDETGLFDWIGSGRYRSAAAMYAYFLDRGLASRTGAQVGDLVVWGGGAHIGIYIGGGRAISALVRGVRIHAVNALTLPFTAYLHTGLSGSGQLLGIATAASARVSTSVRHTITALNVRMAPGTASARIAVLGRGAAVRVLRTALDSLGRPWYRVVYGLRRSGWVAAWLTR